jgi:7,8-dihydroneopterin 2',3'-cyclic phosphate phosphodiesterase
VKGKLLNPKLKALSNKISNKELRKKVVDLLENPTFELNGKRFSGAPLDIAQAGLSHHHCYPGGYMEHVASTANLALALCDSVENIYHGRVNRDIVIASVLLHDLYKPTTYTFNKADTCNSSRLADHLDHLSLAISELVRRNFPLELIHAVAAHHGEYSPIRPHTVEALICHLADLADSRLNGEVLNAAAYLTRKTVGQELLALTSKEAFEIVASKAAEGEAGVAKEYTKIRRERETHKT